jgi:hypothetical protein
LRADFAPGSRRRGPVAFDDVAGGWLGRHGGRFPRAREGCSQTVDLRAKTEDR